MGRITTETGLANLTASLLKVDAITSVTTPDQRSKFAKAANRWYYDVLRETLADHIWNFALKRIQISKDSTAPAFGYGARYLLPTDYIRVATLGDEDNPEKDYKVEDGYLLCNLSSPINLRYVYYQEDVTKFSPKFTMAFAINLAVKCGYEITGSRSLVADLKKEYIDMLSDATSIDGQESPPPYKIQRSRWKSAKEGRALVGSDYQGRVVL